MDNVKFNLNLGIVIGDDMRVFSRYIGLSSFTQRKGFDEYYCDSPWVEFPADIGTLMRLSMAFKVEVCDDHVELSH